MLFNTGTYQVEGKDGGTFILYHITPDSPWPYHGVLKAENGLESPVSLDHNGESKHRGVRIVLPQDDVLALWKMYKSIDDLYQIELERRDNDAAEIASWKARALKAEKLSEDVAAWLNDRIKVEMFT